MSDVSIEFAEAKRFAANDLVVDPDASLKYFIPLAEFSDKVHRDRFGNRVFTSPDKGYVDRQGDINKAALLVSPQGALLQKILEYSMILIKD